MLDHISEHRDEILERWIDGVYEGYPEETAKFLRSKTDPFANPVGAGLRESLAELLDGIIRGVDPEELSSALDRVIRVRAVQEFAPSAAVSFVFDLKGLLREVVGDTLGRSIQLTRESSVLECALSTSICDVANRCGRFGRRRYGINR